MRVLCRTRAIITYSIVSALIILLTNLKNASKVINDLTISPEMILPDEVQKAIEKTRYDLKASPLILYNNATTNTTTNASSMPEATIQIFYNIYIGKHITEGISVVSRQLEILKSSWLAEQAPTLNYFRVGKDINNTFPTLAMKDLCDKHSINCHSLGQIEEAHEEQTLGKMWEYCQDKDDDDQTTVVYLHNKGSFHHWGSNRNYMWCKYLTYSVTRHHCYEKDTREKGCNVCGLSLLNSVFVGNFFVSHCGYVKHLVNPMIFWEKQYQVHEALLAMNLTNLYPKNIKRDKAGISRFANEHWVGTHPNVIPCAVSNKFWKYWQRFSSRGEEQMGPALLPPRMYNATNTTHPCKSKLSTELYRFHKLYQGQHPPLTSWMFEYYPDGPFWKETLQQHNTSQLFDPRAPEDGANMTTLFQTLCL
mmetsp:Transcript_11606/g.17850  ORF Transcript_11606/g.17850 Transcript_11606/m.17850 type:complete len:421 (+) Transcript_11606:48-1310(+)